MNSNTKQRYISTSIWSDDWFDSLSEREKLVYFYLLTNEHTNAAGVYECTLKNVRLEIGMGREEIEVIMAKFAEAGKAFYFRGYIIIPKWLKHQKIGERSKMLLGVAKTLSVLPDEIKTFIADRRHYDYDVSSLTGIPSTGLQDPMPESPAKTGEGIDSLSIGYPENIRQNAHDSDSDSDSDGGGLSEYKLEPASQNKKPPPKLLSILKAKIKQAGYYYDKPILRKIAATIPDPDWITNNHSIIGFVAEKIRRAYKAKSPEEQRKLFASAFSWENIHEEYTDWLVKQVKADEQRELERLRSAIPKQCPECGADLNGNRKCEKCGGFVAFDDETRAWGYNSTFDFSLSENFKKTLAQPPPENHPF